jgi:predicted transcriptional regulator
MYTASPIFSKNIIKQILAKSSKTGGFLFLYLLLQPNRTKNVMRAEIKNNDVEQAFRDTEDVE